jgi:hypothetical protein
MTRSYRCSPDDMVLAYRNCASLTVIPQVVSAEVSGFIFANSRLSGIPDLSLMFADPDVIDDCSFHPCVRYNRYERDRTISFVPPDGQFEVMIMIMMMIMMVLVVIWMMMTRIVKLR